MPSGVTRVVRAWIVAGLVAPWALAQQPQPPAAPPGAPSPEPAKSEKDLDDALAETRAKWVVQFEPTVWYVGPGGHVTLPGSPAGAPEVFLGDLNLDSPRVSPAGTLRFFTNDWTFSVSGEGTSQEDRGFTAPVAEQIGGLTLLPGDRASSSLDFKSFEATAALQLDLPRHLGGQPGGPFAARLDLLGGARVYDVGFDITGPGGTASGGGFFAHPIIGAKLTMDVVRKFSIELQVDGGAFFDGRDRQVWSYDIIAGFLWRPTENVALRIGYRDLAFDLRKGPEGNRFDWQGALQGLSAGINIRF